MPVSKTGRNGRSNLDSGGYTGPMSHYREISDEVLARAIAARRLGASVEIRALAQGSNNKIYSATAAGESVAIKLSRPHRESGALGEYRKEAWCAGAARKQGVRTPEILEVGVEQGRAFAVLNYVDGHAPVASQERDVWRTLGAYARRIHDIPVAGWGGTLTADGCFGESWLAHLDYNIAALEPNDSLIARGVFDSQASRRLRLVFERLRSTDFRFGLCHGDIALWNTLIDNAGETWLLDWGCAFVSVVPHYEINEMLRHGQPVDAFFEGYGLSPEAYAAMAPDLRALSALREVDTLRWAIDRKPDMIGELTPRACAAVAKLV